MEKYKLNLSLFDGDGAAAGGNGAVSSAGTGAAEALETDSGVDLDAAEKEAEEIDTGQPATGINTTSDSLEQKRQRFQELINGEYRDLYDENVQSIVRRRLGEKKALESELNGYKPLISMLAAKYGVDSKDIKNLEKAIEKDDSFYEEAAMKEGLSVEQYKAMKKMESENMQMKEQIENAERITQRNQMFARWNNEAAQVKNIYPNFDLRQELQNEQFINLLGSGVNVMSAYQAIHMDEIMAGTIYQTAQKVAKKQADSIRAGQRRPVENGTTSRASAEGKIDVSKLTDKQLEEYARRAQMGEVITF